MSILSVRLSFRPSLRLSNAWIVTKRKKVVAVVHEVANRQTDRETDKHRRVKHYLLGGGY